MTVLTKSVTLNPGQSQQVPFQVTPQSAGQYSVDVDGLSGSFTAVPPAAPSGRMGKWTYRVACAYPTVHVEKGEWLDHSLNFDFAFNPSTFTITVRCHNDSAAPFLGKLQIMNTNAVMYSQADDEEIPANSYKSFTFAMGLPRSPGQYYFDAVFSVNGVTLDEGRWVINYS